jgi:hypothetical protein
MVQAFTAFMDACYIARRNSISSSVLKRFEATVARFHKLREVFIEVGVRESISLPRQHALSHYAALIKMFGCPNGLCSSMTESQHIASVKKPWRRSNHYHAMHQMLRTLTRLDKLEASRQVFNEKGMLRGSTSWYIENELDMGVHGGTDSEESESDESTAVGEEGDVVEIEEDENDNDNEDDYPQALLGERSPDAVFSVDLCARRGKFSLH